MENRQLNITVYFFSKNYIIYELIMWTMLHMYSPWRWYIRASMKSRATRRIAARGDICGGHERRLILGVVYLITMVTAPGGVKMWPEASVAPKHNITTGGLWRQKAENHDLGLES